MEEQDSVKNILTIDVEDWYQGLDIPESCWSSYEKRLSIGLGFILDLLAEQRAHATFFVLGLAAREHPAWIRHIAEAGHELGTHGWSHTPIYRQSPPQFRRELSRALCTLQDVSGHRVAGHRAAFFSITGQSLWALDELAAMGLGYDSSIFPAHNYRYGLPGANRFPYQLPTHALWELPVSTLAIGCLRLPFGGGFYARFWPYPMLRWAIASLNARGQPAILYFHPWEFDPGQPRLRAESHWLARATHYYGLGSTPKTLRALLGDFEWTTVRGFLDGRP